MTVRASIKFKLDCRKRRMEQNSIPVTPCGEPAGSGPSSKRARMASVTAKKGVWNPNRRDFSKKCDAVTPSQKQLCQEASTPVIATENVANSAVNVIEPDVSPITQYCVSSDTEVDLIDSKVEGEMLRFRDNLIANARLSTNPNNGQPK